LSYTKFILKEKIKMRFTKIFCLALVLSTFLFGCKSTKDAVSDQKLKSERNQNALLWEVSGNGLKENSFVFGTIHIISSEDYFIPKGTLGAIEKAEEMIFEIDMNEMTDLTKQMSLLDEIFMDENKTLKDLLSKEDYAFVEGHFEKMGLPIFFFERMKPMFLTVFASGDIDPAGLQSGSMKSYEFEFFEIASKSKIPVSGLETIEFQMSIFDKIPYEDQADMLIESIKSSEVGGAEFDEMIKIYKSQDIDAMVEMIVSDDSGMGEYEDILVAGRNRNWIPLMQAKMKDRPSFFAVGAGHLGGTQGVINLLKKEGYTLTPLSTESK